MKNNLSQATIETLLSYFDQEFPLIGEEIEGVKTTFDLGFFQRAATE
ncbi:MAG: hypothetical protein ACHQET_06495 [Chitinophagales bacterium]